MPAKATLDDYPALRRWYQERHGQAVHDLSDRLVYGTCEALTRGASVAVRAWTNAFRNFLRSSPSPLEDFLAAEAVMQRCDVELLDLIGELGETAIRAGESTEFLGAMQDGADVTGLVVFRFLSAWTALNSGNAELCAQECEKVAEPFSSVHTLHGQALLELGRAKEALEALDVATKLQPQELLAWFQKAKAQHVLNRRHHAFASLRECLRLAPQSEEVALYMGLIAVETDDASLYQEAWSALRPKFARFANVATVTLTLLRLAVSMGDKPKAQQVLAESAWTGVLSQGEISQSLTTVLRQLSDRGWMDVASTLLGKVTISQVGS